MAKTFDDWLPQIKILHNAAVPFSIYEQDEDGQWQHSDAGPDAITYELAFLDVIEDVMVALGYDMSAFARDSIDYGNDALMQKLIQVYGMAEGTPISYIKEGMIHRNGDEDILDVIKGRLREWDMELNQASAEEILGGVRVLKSIQATAQEAAEILGLQQKHSPQLHALEARLAGTEATRETGRWSH